MYGLGALLLIALGATFGAVWIVHYLPIIKRTPLHKIRKKKYWSPKLLFCKILEPMDAGLTLILIGGGWIGLTSAVGISALIYNVLSGIGISMGVLFIKKFLVPRWKKEYAIEEEKIQSIITKQKVMI